MRMAGQWVGLVALSAVAAAALEMANLPAALLIGPMLAAIAMGVAGARLRLPFLAGRSAFAVIGVMIAAAIEPRLFAALLTDGPVLIGATLATLAASSLLGWLIGRWKVLPGTTAIWGSAPGAASAMVLMAQAFGADERLVAFMQYVRVIMVSVGAAVIAGLFIDVPAAAPATVDWFPTLDRQAFAATLGVALVGAVGGALLRLPSPQFLGPMILGVALHIGVGLEFQLPAWLLAAAYTLTGWSIGLRFDRAVIGSAIRSLPQVLLSVLVLMAFCGGIAWLLAHYMGIDPLTAYLATSPGGMDSVAIIAAAADGVDVAFVMAMQMMRFLIVLIFGPSIARLLVRRLRDD